MFKLVKWAFKLGQQTERQRIANILNEHRRAPLYPGHEFRFKEDLTDEEQNRQEELRQAVNGEINNLVDNITQPNQYEESRYSLLYPKEDK